ncbi:MAG TPA: OmpA family protein [Puia sp.]|nr:OmpA family protein [Puia sp.]
MAFNFLDSVKGLFSGDLVAKAASSLGEGEGSIAKALTGIVPAVLGGIVSKGTSGIDGASSVLDLAKNAAGSGIIGNLGNMFGGGGSPMLSSGLDMARRLMGDKLTGIAGIISGFAGIKDSSVSSLLGMVAPMALGVLGQHASQNNLTPGSLSNLLASQKDSITAALPAGLSSLAGLTGLSAAGSAISSATGSAISSATGSVKQAASSPHGAAYSTVEKSAGTGRWLLPLVLAIVGILIVWLLSRSCNKEVTTTAPITDTATAITAAPSLGAPVSIKVKLPDGTELDANKGGIEDELVTYLNSSDPADSISKNRWFDFDNLNFKTGSSEMTGESSKQVNNIAAILKAYPKVKIKIGGYTDKTGNEDANMKLSQQRAEAVTTALKATGAGADQLTAAEGYGSQFAKAAADATDEERKKDRRIAINVRNK